MKKDGYKKFEVSLSVVSYPSKTAVAAALASGKDGRLLRASLGIKEKVAFKNYLLTPKTLLNAALNGYTFCPPHSNFPNNTYNKTYVREDGAYTLSGKADKFFTGSNFIGVDIDKTSYKSPSEYIAILKYKPTLWYTSFSNQQLDNNGISKGARFRMVYVFEQTIHGKYYFRYWANQLYDMIESGTKELIEDRCGMSPSQYFNGTNQSDKTLAVEYGLTNLVYSSDDMAVNDSGYLEFLSRYCDYKSPNQDIKSEIESEYHLLYPQCSTILPENPFENYRQEEIRKAQNITVNKTLFNDAGRLEWDEFYDIYKEKYPYIYRVERDYDWHVIHINGVEVKYQECKEDFFELRWPTIRNKDGQMIRISDGHHRRSTLFHRAWLRRIIMPKITPDIMFFNLIVDRDRFFDNSDHVLDTETLLRKVQDSFAHDVSYFKEKYKNVYESNLELSKKKEYIFYRSSCKVNISTLKKELLWQKLDKVYDATKSVADNHRILNDSDIAVSKSTLYRYIKERNMKCSKSKYDSFKKLHKDGMSLRDEIEYLAAQGLKISIRTLSKYRERLAKESSK